MDEQQREDYLLDALQRKLAELKTTALNEKPSGEHQHGPDYQRGAAAGFVSGLGFAMRVLAPEGELWQKAAKMLDDYNLWAQAFNRQGRD